MDTLNPHPTDQPELGLSELLSTLRRGRVLIACFVLVSAVAAGLASWLIPKSYKATTVLSPVTNTQGSGQFGSVSSLLSQFGGLASLAGLAPGGETTKRAESLAVLESEALTEKYIQQNDLLPVLFHDSWDARNRRWTETDPRHVPTLWKGNEYFKDKVRSIVTDSKTGLVTLTITWKDPHVAANWANGLVALTNDYLRKKAIEESERNIAYLNAQANKTDVVAVKQAIYTILQTEINKEMLARGSDEYAFKILDPAVAPEKPSNPTLAFMVAIAVFGSLALSVLIAFIRIAWLKP